MVRPLIQFVFRFRLRMTSIRPDSAERQASSAVISLLTVSVSPRVREALSRGYFTPRRVRPETVRSRGIRERKR